MIDTLSMVMVLVVTGVGTIIHFYSIGYMAKDDGYARYFAYLNLFMFAMLVLVTAKSLPVLFVGWEGVGLCSYLLIGFWYKDIKNAAAGKKAFIVNRIGDFAFLLGIFVVFVATLKHRIAHARLHRASRPGERAPRGVRGVGDRRGDPLLHRRDGKIRSDSPLRVAPRRDGGSHAGERSHPRGDHGDGGRLHGRASLVPLSREPDGDGGRRDRRGR